LKMGVFKQVTHSTCVMWVGPNGMTSVLMRKDLAGCWWLTPVILATWEAEIRRILVQGHPKQIVHETPSPK
jgi:hypothetical protein